MKKLTKILDTVAMVIFFVALAATIIGLFGLIVTLVMFMFTLNLFAGLFTGGIALAALAYGISFLFPEE